MSATPKTGWILLENGDDLRAFDGWLAELWFYHNVPHGTLGIRLSPQGQEGEFHLILDGCGFSNIPSSWRISALLCRRISRNTLAFEDRAAGVSLRANAARVLDPEGYENYLGILNRSSLEAD